MLTNMYLLNYILQYLYNFILLKMFPIYSIMKFYEVIFMKFGWISQLFTESVRNH